MDDTDKRISDLDEIDIDLLRRIEEDFDVNLEELSEELDFSKSAIHYRLKNHRENGIIRRVSADLDPLAFGLNMVMITEVMVTHERGYAEEIGEQLASVPGVQQVYYTMGDVDFMVISRTQNREQMNDLIDDLVAIEGVNETSSRFVMKELQTDGNVLANMSDGMCERILDYDG
jgi:DNA-binding Lrp family transcriptional regulator